VQQAGVDVSWRSALEAPQRLLQRVQREGRIVRRDSLRAPHAHLTLAVRPHEAGFSVAALSSLRPAQLEQAPS